MVRRLRGFLVSLSVFAGFAMLVVSLSASGIWYTTRPTTYDFDNGARLIVPCGAISIDQREEGNGIVVESGTNVTVYNDSHEWRSLTVSYRKPNYGILDIHAFEELPPKSSKIFGADYTRYEGMHVSVSDYAQKKRDEATK